MIACHFYMIINKCKQSHVASEEGILYNTK